jgi:hypothetical protein
MVLFDLGESEGPVSLDEFLAFGLEGLKEHIGLVVDLVRLEELQEPFLEVLVL